MPTSAGVVLDQELIQRNPAPANPHHQGAAQDPHHPQLLRLPELRGEACEGTASAGGVCLGWELGTRAGPSTQRCLSAAHHVPHSTALHQHRCQVSPADRQGKELLAGAQNGCFWHRHVGKRAATHVPLGTGIPWDMGGSPVPSLRHCKGSDSKGRGAGGPQHGAGCAWVSEQAQDPGPGGDSSVGQQWGAALTRYLLALICSTWKRLAQLHWATCLFTWKTARVGQAHGRAPASCHRGPLAIPRPGSGRHPQSGAAGPG